MTPEVEEITPYILRVYALSFVPLVLNTFATCYLQSVDYSKSADLISLSRGLILNALFLYLFPAIMGGNGIWWAIFAAETLTAVLSSFYLIFQYKKFRI